MKYYFDYDKEVDVLYISIGKKPQKADFARRLGDIILRFKDNLIIGITILNAQKFIAKVKEIKE